MDITGRTQNILSLCTGLGGLERGIKRTGMPIRTVCYVEREAFILSNLVTGMEAGILDTAPIWTDIKTFNGKPFHGMVDGITGGYPCPPFSTAGKRLGAQDPRHLWPYIHDIISDVRPGWCFFENVEGHLSLGYQQVKNELEALHYVVKEGIYSAAEVGAPHGRKRLFILALANSHNNRPDAAQNTKSTETRDHRNQTRAHQFFQSAGCSWPRTDETLGNSDCPGLSKSFSTGQPSLYGQVKPFQGCSTDRTTPTQWPSKQGERQHDWEERRLVKSGLGCTINGYNFREDLLRALGNSVVEQTAELAFNDLIRKHETENP